VGLPLSGTKGILQQRLRAFFEGLLNKHDSARFNIGKSVAAVERGVAYGQSRAAYDIYRGRGNDYSRPNGYHASGTSNATSSQNNPWGMSSVYQNVRLRITRLFLTNR
jgi:hypothetical protein